MAICLFTAPSGALLEFLTGISPRKSRPTNSAKPSKNQWENRQTSSILVILDELGMIFPNDFFGWVLKKHFRFVWVSLDRHENQSLNRHFEEVAVIN